MEEKTEVKAVELVRNIRDQQAELLAGKSQEEIIEFFRQAGEAAIRAAKPPIAGAKPANMHLHQTA
jgi:hypothetical protein